MKGYFQNLNFIVIGAAKGGTTALFEYLRQHPNIYIPKGKELPFFCDDKIYPKGLNWYLKSVFAKAPTNSLCGTITPQYMMGMKDVDIETIANRICIDCPDCRLIAVLRHPVKRCYSQYRMMLRQGYENRSFIESTMDTINHREYINTLERKDTPLIGSEYGRILSEYFTVFPQNQIKIIFAEDLKFTPENEITSLFDFLGLPPVQILSIKDINQGGSSPKFHFLTPNFLNRTPLAYLWQTFIPYRIQKTINFKINTWNIKADDAKLDLQDPTIEFLYDYYQPDVEILQRLIGRKTPWKGFNQYIN